MASSGTCGFVTRVPSESMAKIERRLPRLNQRFRFLIQQKPRDQTPPGRLQNPSNLAKVIHYLVRQHVGEYRSYKHKVEASVGKRKYVLAAAVLPLWPILLVVDIRNLKPKVRIAWRDPFRAPLDSALDDVESFIVSLRRKIAGKRNRHPADTTTDIEHAFVFVEAAEIAEISEKLLAAAAEVPRADEDHPSRRNHRITPP